MSVFQWNTSEICTVSIERGDEVVAGFTSWNQLATENRVCRLIKENRRKFNRAADLLEFLRQNRGDYPELAGAVLYTGGAGAMRLTRRGEI